MDHILPENSNGGFDSFEQKLGDELRGERATMGKSLLDVQRDLRVKASYISAIENCDVSVFPNVSFVAGYVRSYARYLGLDSEATFERFCAEANFQSASVELGGKAARAPRKTPNTTQPLTNPQAWVPSMPGGGMANSANANAALAAAGPVLALGAVIIGLGFAVWFVLQDIQRVEFAPIEDNPMVAFAPEALGAAGNDGFSASSIELAADPSILYNRRELEVPIVEPRDGPIFALNPDAALGTISVVDPTSAELLVAVTALAAPIVSETPHIPSVSIVAQQEAWVRVYQENGTIIFEKTLAAGEQYVLPADTPDAYLRAGNAASVYVMVDDKAYGPVSTNGVVRDVALMAPEISGKFNLVDRPSVALQVAADAWRKVNVARLAD